ncbi:MAG: hypothetical protein ACRD3D_01120 [Terriglobia bacterium]
MPVKDGKPLASASRVRARKAASLMLAGATQRDAMRTAGFSESAVMRGAKNEVEAVRKEFNRLLDKAIPPAMMVERALEGLNAMRIEAFLHKNTGAVVYSKPLPDNMSRFKNLELLAKMRGLIVRREESKVEHTIDLHQVISEARARAKSLPAGADATVEASDVTACDTRDDRALPSNELGQSQLGQSPNVTDRDGIDGAKS